MSAEVPLRGSWRSVRAAVLGGTSMLLATGAHVLAGGRLPSAGVLLVLAFLVGLTAVTVTARRCRFAVLLAVLGVEQLLLHEVFDAAAMTSTGCTPPLAVHDSVMAGCLAGMHAIGSGATAAAGTGSGLWMPAAHVAATLATAWLLARGERCLWRLCDRAFRTATATVSLRVRRPRPQRSVPTTAARAARVGRSAVPRGPPRLVPST